MKAIIIDDEPLARMHLKEELKLWDKMFTHVWEATNGLEAVEMIDKLKPDVVFLDIQMPEMDGFDVVKEIKHKPHVVFVTAYDKYAIQAFENNAIDYLLKPVSSERLAQAIHKVEEWQNHNDYQKKIDQLLNYIHNPEDRVTRLQVKANDLIYFIEIKDVYYFHAENKLTYAFCKDGEHIVDYPLNAIENKTSPDEFFRISRSDLINLKYLKEIRKWFNGKYVVLLKPYPDRYLEITRRKINSLLSKI